MHKKYIRNLLVYLFVLVTACTNIKYKDKIKLTEDNIKYYSELIPKVDSVTLYQNEILSSGLVTEIDINNNVLSKNATYNDSINAIRFINEMNVIKPIIIKIINDYSLLKSMYETVGINESQMEKAAIDLQYKLISDNEINMESKISYFKRHFTVSLEQYLDRGLPHKQSKFDDLLINSD